LIKRKKTNFLKILKFIHYLKQTTFVVDELKLNKAIESTNFKKMQNLEKENNFIEAKIDPKTGENITFFNLGEKNKWENILDPKIRKKIENYFKREMLELGYL